jgi:hypothetical protein
MKKKKGAAGYAVQWLQTDQRAKGGLPYIKPSSLAKGCLLYVAFELMGKPKPAFDERVGRILSVGTDSHRRLQRGLSRTCLAQEVFFEVEEYRIHGFCDGILYVPPERALDESAVGYWALEFKTAAASEFDKVKAAGMPKEEHVRQSQIYLWGIDRYYHGTVPLKGAIVYYENRDTLEHAAFEVYYDPEGMADLLIRIKDMLDAVGRGELPDDYLPEDHWGHSYCPYLEICEPGQKAMAWQKAQPKELPDKVMADIIAKRIVAKKGAERMLNEATGHGNGNGNGKANGNGAKKPMKKKERSLLDLVEDLKWDAKE